MNSELECPCRESDFNFDWKFSRSCPNDGKSLSIDDQRWLVVRLPQDCSVEEPYSQENDEAVVVLALCVVGLNLSRNIQNKRQSDHVVTFCGQAVLTLSS